MVEQEEQQAGQAGIGGGGGRLLHRNGAGDGVGEDAPRALTHLISRPAVSATAVAPRTARDLSMLAGAVALLSKLIQLPCSRCQADGGLWRAWAPMQLPWWRGACC